ncbi:MAG: hypothetical protein FMNOHCHN_01399 [Ignavibacteriaceae bacterium]|nr:hypothetical protein [Ignavibacteriaceae bacterium]
MKRNIIFSIILLAGGLLLTGCEEYGYDADYTPPSAPRNLLIMNGDGLVELFWDESRESDVSGYNVYVSTSYNGRYELIGSTRRNYFLDDEVINGNTYFYAVAAFDYSGNESSLSSDYAYVIPRPEGYNQSIFDYRRFPNNSGYNLTTERVVAFDDNLSDFFFENYNGQFYLNVWDDTDIKDMGPTVDLYEITRAPESGWASTKDAVAKVGHTYIIWTWNNHFAKIRITSITRDRVVFDWAYQEVEGSRMLKPVSQERNTLTRSFTR